jgi:hypothetical protein
MFDVDKELLAKSNVSVVFRGTKIKNGIDTKEPCVVVGVEKKLPLDLLKEDDLIPEVIKNERTDVQVFDKISSIATCTGGTGLVCSPHGDKYRPLIGGISATEEGGTACTLGALVKDSRDGKLVALTNNHCAGTFYNPEFLTPTSGTLDPAGINMMQPSPLDGGTEADIYGVVKRSVPMEFGTATAAFNIVDASISTIAVDDAGLQILEVDDGPFSFVARDDYVVGTEVYKSGRTTGVTPLPATEVTAKSASANVSYGADPTNDVAPFFDQIICTAPTRFTQDGDSGSAIVAFINGAYQIIGLLFAANTSGTLAVVTPIEHIVSELEIEPWNGNVVVPYSTSNVIFVNGNCYSLVGNVKSSVTHTED